MLLDVCVEVLFTLEVCADETAVLDVTPALDGEVLTAVLAGASVAVLLVGDVLLTLLTPVELALDTLDADASVILRDVLVDVPSPARVLLRLVKTRSDPVWCLLPLHLSALSIAMWW